MSFIDKCKLFLKAGNGGDGIVAWRREAHVPLGGPAGGNGGNGGSIFFIGDNNETSLETLVYKKKIRAADGIKGDIKNMHGSNANDTYIKVPLGTVVYNDDTNELIADIISPNEPYLIAKGGMGGHGNAHFKSGFNKAPTLYELGDLGQELNIRCELKQIANIGIIGLPNAGKSTLISSITNAKPKTANYSFTTLNPILGAYDHNNKKIIFADIPGLIEGASEGKGLGHDFLRHIERCQILIHLISGSIEDTNDIINDYLVINNELKKYSSSLFNKKIIVCINKLDEDIDAINYWKLKKFLKDEQLFYISALNKTNIDIFLNDVLKTYDFIIANEQNSIDEINVIKTNINKKQTPDSDLSKELFIKKLDDNIWEVKCEFLKYWSHKIPLNTPDNLIRYNQKLSSVNFEPALMEAGAINGDTVIVYNNQLTFEA